MLVSKAKGLKFTWFWRVPAKPRDVPLPVHNDPAVAFSLRSAEPCGIHIQFNNHNDLCDPKFTFAPCVFFLSLFLTNSKQKKKEKKIIMEFSFGHAHSARQEYCTQNATGPL